MHVYLNGNYLQQESAKISIADRGFIFGDGIYEVIRSVEGRLFKENEHLDRLDEGLKALDINLKKERKTKIPEIARELLSRNHLLEGEATIYLQITRGAAWPRTHTFPDPPVDTTMYLSASSFSPYGDLHEKGVDAITVSDVRWTRCNLKTVQLLPNTLARQQAKQAGVNSAVMIRDGVVTESPNANIFIVKKGTLYTFPVSNYILNGITRQLVLDIAADLQIPVKQVPVRDEEIYNIDELFFSGTTTDIQPVVEINGRPIGDGKPGPVVKEIQKAYREQLYGNR